MLKKLAVVGGLVALLAGCSRDDNWTVTDKQHCPEEKVVERATLFVDPFFLDLPTGREYIRPERYQLKLKQDLLIPGPRVPIPSTAITEKDVSEEEYASIKVGSAYIWAD